MSIEIKNISKQFKDTVVLKDINLTINSGELVALLGPSGSGKTTLLRIIAGLEFADTGSIVLHDKEAQIKQAKNRNVGFVFQHYALFKHMTVFENVAFGLKVRPRKIRLSAKEIKHKVNDLLHLVHLEAFHAHYPSQLSGGQRQRVALVRALAVDPHVLLLDEPFGSLDAKVRKELRRWMRRLHDEIHATSIFVTHDQEEALDVADRVVVMNEGRIKQFATPEEVWLHPADKFVYDFLGNYNEFAAWKDEQGKVHLFPEKELDKAIKIYARPHEMYVTKNAVEPGCVLGKVTHINPTGSLVKIELEQRNRQILQIEISAKLFSELDIKKGEPLFVRPAEFKEFDN